MPQRDKRGAFTLIELLVVIAVVSLLLAVIIPSLRSAKDSAKRLVCVSNLRQLTLAWTLYAQDNDNVLCSPCPCWHGDDQKYSWIFWDETWPWPYDWEEWQWQEAMTRGALWEYNNKGQDVYRCPAGLQNEKITYAGFGSMGWKEPANRLIDGKTYQKLSQIPLPGTRAVFIDEGMLTPQFFGVYYKLEAWFDPPPSRHLLGTTMAFADAHAEYWEWKDPRTREMCQLQYDDYELTWKGVPCPDNEDLFRMQMAAWENNQ